MVDQSLSRRTLLRGAGAVGVGLHRSVVAAGRQPLPADPGTVRLGVASYSLRNLPRAKALAAVGALRTPFVNLKSVHRPYDLPAGERAAALTIGAGWGDVDRPGGGRTRGRTRLRGVHGGGASVRRWMADE